VLCVEDYLFQTSCLTVSAHVLFVVVSTCFRRVF
jgi:hypothetical protein